MKKIQASSITGALSPAILARANELAVERVFEKPVTARDLIHFVNSKLS